MAIMSEHLGKYLSEYEDSGMNVKEFCIQHKLDYNNFYYLVRKQRKNLQKRSPSKPNFIPVNVVKEIHEEKCDFLFKLQFNALGVLASEFNLGKLCYFLKKIYHDGAK